MPPFIEQARAHIQPILEGVEARLRARFPELHIHVYGGPVGQLTDYQGHDFGLECVFPHAPKHATNSVALAIGFRGALRNEPTLNEACVSWGNPSCQTELDLLDGAERSPPDWQTIEHLLDQLCVAFECAIERGKPLE